MKLILIRHADPDYENDALTVAGHEQASLLAESLRSTDGHAVFKLVCLNDLSHTRAPNACQRH